MIIEAKNLYRLLSGYLNKCHNLGVRRGEKHCEPNVVFNPDPDVMTDAKGILFPFASVMSGSGLNTTLGSQCFSPRRTPGL